MLKNLPVRNPNALVLFSNDPSEGIFTGTQHGHWKLFSNAAYTFLREHNSVFEDLCSFQSSHFAVRVRWQGAHGEQPHSADGELVSGNYFATLGVRAFLGRTISSSDDQTGSPPVAMISFGYWKREGADRNIVGRIADLNGTDVVVIGVAAPEFFGVKMRRPPDFWLPMSTQPVITLTGRSFLQDPQVYWLNLLGRLKPGIARSEAQSSLNFLLNEFVNSQEGESSTSRKNSNREPSYVQLVAGARGISSLRLRYSEPLHVLMAMVALLLLIACLNVSTLFLARAVTRERELSVRQALGADKFRLVRQLLTESLLIAFIGGAVSLLLSSWMVTVLVKLFAGSGFPLSARPDFKVWFFILGLCLITGVLFGTAPALRSLRIELISNLKGIAPSAKSRGLRLNFGKSFVVLQVAVSMILLVSAGLLTRSLVELENQQLGFEPRNVLIAKMGARLGGYRSEQLPGLLRHALERVRALPGVERATVAVYSPISGNQNDTSISIPGYVPQPNERMNIQRNWVGPDYFQTLGIAIKEGRGIGREDLEGAPRVAVVSENVVHRFFSREDPIGHKFYAGSATAPGDEIEIIGVVEDTKFDSLRGQASPMVFFPAFQKAGESFPWADELEVRISGSPESAAAELRQAIRSIDPNLPLQKINLLDQQITDSLQRERTTAKLANHFATLALLLACVGILGLVTHTVIHRTNEIGLRMAVGAGSQQVLWMIMRECLVMITTGLVLGIVAAIISARLLQHQLFAVQSADPMTMLFASALLFLTAMLASYIPARRATKIDPMVALRYE